METTASQSTYELCLQSACRANGKNKNNNYKNNNNNNNNNNNDNNNNNNSTKLHSQSKLEVVLA